PLEADAPLLREPAEVEEAVVLLGTGVLPPAILPVVAAASVIAPLPTAERAGHRAVGAEGLVVAAGQLDLAMGGAAAGIGDEVDRATERVPAQQRGGAGENLHPAYMLHRQQVEVHLGGVGLILADAVEEDRDPLRQPDDGRRIEAAGRDGHFVAGAE